MEEEKKLVTSGEAAKLLKVSRRTIQYWIKSGILIPDEVRKNNYREYKYFSQETLKKCAKFLEENLQKWDKKYLKVRQKSKSAQNFSGVQSAQKESKKVGKKVQSVTSEILTQEVLPTSYYTGVTKFMRKLKVAGLNKDFKTAFNKDETIFTFGRLDYAREGITLERNFDDTDEMILNALYSIGRDFVPEDDGSGNYQGDWQPVFTARKILQRIFGNVADHFQKEIVENVEKHIEDMSYMKLTLDLRDKDGSDAYVTINGEKYHPVSIKDSLLDVTILSLKTSKSGKKFGVYKLNRKSPLFIYAEKLKQIASWATVHMTVPCQKTIQNAIITNYLLTKIALVKNPHNHYLNTGILFDTLYEELKLDVSTRKKKKIIRDNIKLMFDYWVKTKLLTSYEFLKNGSAFYKIMFNVNLAEVCD